MNNISPIKIGDSGNGIVRFPLLRNMQKTSFSLGLLAVLSCCQGTSNPQKGEIQENSTSKILAYTDTVLYLDPIFTQKIKTQVQQQLLDSSTVWYLGLLDAMQSDNWHLPKQDAGIGSYVSLCVDGVTYIVMSFDVPSDRPYGTNAVISYAPLQSQVVLNINRVRIFCETQQLNPLQQKNLVESIRLQEIYENRYTIQTKESVKTDTINLFGEMVSLLHGGDDYLYFRLHTLSKPVLLLSQLKGEIIQTVTDHGGYDIAESLYKKGMITYLQSTNRYKDFLQEEVINTKEGNDQLIQKYFSDTETLLLYILGE